MVNEPVFHDANAKNSRATLKLLTKSTDRAEGAKVALSKVLQVVKGALGAVGLESSKLQIAVMEAYQQP